MLTDLLYRLRVLPLSNLHKRPPLRDLLCRIGRHDYEFECRLGTDGALLQCFYCGAKKSSTRS